MIQQTFVRWALYILFQFVKSPFRHLYQISTQWMIWTIIFSCLKNKDLSNPTYLLGIDSKMLLFEFICIWKEKCNTCLDKETFPICFKQLNMAYNHPVTGQKKTVPLHINSYKAFRERQHPQPLDQWTNSLFIGQQVGNCMSFTLTHYLANLFAMHWGPRLIPLCIQHHIPFQVSWPSHSWDTAIPYFTLKIQGQDHHGGQSSKSQHGSNILSIQILFFPCQSAIPFLWQRFFSKFHLENPKSRS